MTTLKSVKAQMSYGAENANMHTGNDAEKRKTTTLKSAKAQMGYSAENAKAQMSNRAQRRNSQMGNSAEKRNSSDEQQRLKTQQTQWVKALTSHPDG